MPATLGWRQKQFYTWRCRLFKPARTLAATGLPGPDTYTLEESDVKCRIRKTSNYNDAFDAGRLRTENFLVTDSFSFGWDQNIGADWVMQNTTLDADGNQDQDYGDFWVVKGAPQSVTHQGGRRAGRRVVYATQERKAPPGIDLRDHLRAFWKLNDTTWVDSSGHGHTLTPVGDPVTAAGKIGNAAELLTGQYLRALTDQVPLRFGDQDWTVALWVYMADVSVTQTLFAAWQEALNLRGWAVGYDATLGRFYLLVTSDGTAGTTAQVNADQFGPATANTWYLVIAWHDATNDQLGIQIGDGTTLYDADLIGHTAGVYKSTATVTLGRNSDGSTSPMTGRLDAAGMWGDLVLSTLQKTLLHADGDGSEYPFV